MIMLLDYGLLDALRYRSLILLCRQWCLCCGGIACFTGPRLEATCYGSVANGYSVWLVGVLDLGMLVFRLLGIRGIEELDINC